MANIEYLAKIKQLLEELKANLEQEENILEERKKKLIEVLKVLDTILGQQSFLVASDLLHPSSTQIDSQELHSLLEVSSGENDSQETEKDFILKSEEAGIPLAQIQIDKEKISITPIPKKTFKQDAVEIQDFILGKVLKEIQKEDRKIKFKIDEEKGFIKTISVFNHSSNRQMNRILGAIRWAFTKILEKS